MNSKILKHLRQDKLPHIWCPGCAHGIVLRSLLEAIDNTGLNTSKTVIVAGIGCASRASGYLDFDTVHTVHGRAIPYATGIKLANPELKVIVITGDGDATAIGGNHLIHGIRRNIDITTVIFNNNVYGMTSGQYSPTTPSGAWAATSPYGHLDRPFDICELAIGAGATYVARGTAYHQTQLTKLIEKGIKHNGFAVIDALSTCPTYFGRKNKRGTAADMITWFKENTITVKANSVNDINQNKDDNSKMKIGEFRNINDVPEFTNEYQKLITQVMKGE
ncbi:2-oxoacid:ferredoxin oxidoreductase subunit beta [Desulfuribacillus alkaliarsenatis]|uniref:2-oxoacid:ferredoxin oxidoreductase subunit beta n=1 Tax=Desulfuribacillus alkaliarsenatis TaxID=766136 RepID=A0A1E5G6G1_9FIRM|nr:2-oxoacid:ferredoxin oxidoreductase subunit beta [Desulfuribacillus alkaliarsenatis]OEF98685.1 2-oxoacid:ferredoxin oxidoreductase subunit beta [Desulfuribacillus alkaliarsenatis]